MKLQKRPPCGEFMFSPFSQMTFCAYRHIFGREREGIHAMRLFDVAVVDVVATLAAGILIAVIFRVSALLTCALLFVAGIIAHALFCVDTKINTLLFGQRVQ